MAEVFSVPASTSLLNEVNALAPKRSKASDGTIGNRAHSLSVSDHNLDETGNTGGVEDADAINEVHARDITSAGPWPAGWSMERIVQLILSRCRSGAEKRLRYVIFNRRIWSASSGWVQKAYNGASPHTEHAHFSFRYGSGSGVSNPENITSPWGILAAGVQEDDVELSDHIGNKAYASRTVGTFANDLQGLRDVVRGDETGTKAAAYPPNSPLMRLLAVPAQLATLTAAVTALTGKDFTDEDAIVAGVLAGLDPAAIAAAVAAALPADQAKQVADELASRLAA